MNILIPAGSDKSDCCSHKVDALEQEKGVAVLLTHPSVQGAAAALRAPVKWLWLGPSGKITCQPPTQHESSTPEPALWAAWVHRGAVQGGDRVWKGEAGEEKGRRALSRTEMAGQWLFIGSPLTDDSFSIVSHLICSSFYELKRLLHYWVLKFNNLLWRSSSQQQIQLWISMNSCFKPVLTPFPHLALSGNLCETLWQVHSWAQELSESTARRGLTLAVWLVLWSSAPLKIRLNILSFNCRDVLLSEDSNCTLFIVQGSFLWGGSFNLLI